MKALGIIFLTMLGIASVGMIALCAGCLFVVGSIPEQTPEQKAANDKKYKLQSSAMACKKLTELTVSQVLKSPKSAEFELLPQLIDEQTVKVTGHVDSQNSFGGNATQQHHFYLRHIRHTNHSSSMARRQKVD